MSDKIKMGKLSREVKAKVGRGTIADATDYIIALEEVIAEHLANKESVSLFGFGTFKIVERKAKMGRNPKTNEEFPIPKTNRIKLEKGTMLKESEDKIKYSK